MFILQLSLVIIAVFAVVVYRAAVYAVLAATQNYNMGAVSVATSGTAALINLIIIMLLNKVLELVPGLKFDYYAIIYNNFKEVFLLLLGPYN